MFRHDEQLQRSCLKLHQKHVGKVPAVRTFQDWVAKGNKFASLAGAGKYPLSRFLSSTSQLSGSIYLLMIIAGKNMRSFISKLTGDIISQICDLIIQPSEGKQYLNDIKNDLI
jgi:hypothetical protein